ncbi:MAG: serine protease [Deltaproteobacteria bacterium]|nr:serine protease [Deltaproteobacteria bacterium]
MKKVALLTVALLSLGVFLAAAGVSAEPPSVGEVPDAEPDLAVDADGVGDDDSAGSQPGTAVPVDLGPGRVEVFTLDDQIINRGTRDYFVEGLESAQADAEVRAVVLVLDTPGGSLQSTREIVKAMLASETPIIVYVGPEGSRAASAGTFITMAAHVAAMAPATNIGAAHPVIMKPPVGPGSEDKGEAGKDSEAAMLEKVTNDSVAFIRNIADQRGRNADWAEQAVRDSVSIQVTEAVELGVVDLEAKGLGELLATIDGRTVEVAGGKQVVLRTQGQVLDQAMTLAQKVLTVLTHPNVTFLLMALGALGLYLEFNNPGLIVPGVVGAIALLLAAFGLSFIPVNILALLFVIIGFGCLIAEVYVTSFGLFTTAGLASIVFGGLFLVKESPEFTVGVSPTVVIAVAAFSAVVTLGVGWLVYRGQVREVVGGSEGMVGAEARVLREIPGGRAVGQVFVHGERWSARCEQPVARDQYVRVVRVDGLVLEVEREAAATTEDLSS